MNLKSITTIFLDVDGIFTDGSLYYSDDGRNFIKFNVYDGLGCMLLKEVGIEILVLTARNSNAVVRRFKELGINKIFTKILKKREFVIEYSKSHNLKKQELAMMGDDLQDLLVKDVVGHFFTTPNAIKIVKDSADFVTKRTGGNGAVREICDLIIDSKGSSATKEFDLYIQNKC